MVDPVRDNFGFSRGSGQIVREVSGSRFRNRYDPARSGGGQPQQEIPEGQIECPKEFRMPFVLEIMEYRYRRTAR